jgi:hypothetical protein
MEYSIRQDIAKQKYELELDSLRLFELTTHLTNIKSENQSDYAIDLTTNSIDIVKLKIARHKIELRELNSRLSS